ncbi:MULTISPECIES: tyrosine/phenylalanine carboxypeptidase domain-containing protein [unclassified Pseudoalteromonas]|uniref:tyrosine/phenylalanine carboxypeptidase domain-containing protein n=1 Tax=unclassified Pseudoalteromonas TaxID=194690 RepID=UPI0030145FEB
MDSGILSLNEAFSLATRVFRVGGFTKDHLYLKGFTYVCNWPNSVSSITSI